MTDFDDWDLPDDYQKPSDTEAPSSSLLIPTNFSQAELLKAHYSQEGLNEVVKAKSNKNGLDWNKIAYDASNIYITGKYTQAEIAKQFGVTESQLKRHVDLKGIRMMYQAELAKKAYNEAMEKGGDMLKFVLDRQAGWNAKSEVEHKGEINLRPVLNIGPKKVVPVLPDVEVEVE